MTKTEIEEYAKSVNDPKLANDETGMVVQVWNDGEITCQKCGSLLWQRTLHCWKSGHPTNSVEMPHKYQKDYSYAFVSKEEAYKISEMIFNIGISKEKIDGIMVSPCVGCGYCCITAPCWVAQRIYGNGVTECPGLIWDEEKKRYFCFLCTINVVGKDYREELHIEKGCCSNLNDWRKDVKPRREKDSPKVELLSLDSLFQKFLNCMGKEIIAGDTIYLILSRFAGELEKDGKSKNEIKNINNLIIHYLKGQRSSFIDDFMGGL
jgi:hypothetical protein